jgi:hypothetical protein
MTMASDDTLAPELDRLCRLDAVAALLPELVRALDGRDVRMKRYGLE